MRVISGTARGTKLNTINDVATRPTLDRVKEPLFSIIQTYLQEANVLDLFAGSGALGIEALSRGAEHCTFCDKSFQSIQILKENIKKTKMEDKSTILVQDYKKCLKELKETFAIIFIDPPYKQDIAVDAIKRIMQLGLLAKEGIIILETDEEERELEELEKVEVEVYNRKKYGRVKLLFLRERG